MTLYLFPYILDSSCLLFLTLILIPICQHVLNDSAPPKTKTKNTKNTKTTTKPGLQNKEGTVIFLGVDNAGKTSLMSVLRDGRVSQSSPTYHGTSEELQLGSLKIKAHDLGGHKQARVLWKNYMYATDAIVFMVDAADSARFSEVRDELHALLMNEDVIEVPILILGNKIDVEGAAQEEELKEALMLTSHTTGKGTVSRSLLQTRPLEVFMCTVSRKSGYGEGFRWLANYL